MNEVLYVIKNTVKGEVVKVSRERIDNCDLNLPNYYMAFPVYKDEVTEINWDELLEKIEK